jgi:hypothetical protein
MQSLPLNAKISMTQRRIREWVDEYGEDGVYISFSGGKDSTVLLNIARKLYPNIRAVFVDTGLEYPEIRAFVKGFDNVDWIRPKLTFREVIGKYGYPFISKEVSETVYYARKYMKSLDAMKEENTIPERERERERERESSVLRSDGGSNRSRQKNKQRESKLQNVEKGDYP